MDTKANYVAVGLFVVLAMLATFGSLYWAYGVDSTTETATLRIRIPGSAAGLGRGSAVLFNGVKVGDIQRVYIDINNPRAAIADAKVDRLTPITESTRADIGIAGLTGQANVELKGGDPTEVNLLRQAEEAGTIAEIEASPSAVTDLLQTAQDIFSRANRAVTSFEGFVEDVRGPLTSTVTNVETFSQSLASNAEGVNEFLANFGELSKTLGTVSLRLDSTLAAAEDLIRAVDHDKVANIVGNVETFTETLKTASADIDRIVANVEQTSESVRTFADNANGTLGRVDGILDEVKTGVGTAVASFDRLSNQASGTLTKVDGVLDSAKGGIDQAAGSITRFADDASGTLARADEILASVDPAKVESALTSIEGAATDARKAAGDVSSLTERFSARGEDIEQIITNARSITDNFAQASTRVDGVLKKVDTILAEVDAEAVNKAIGDFSGAAADARKAASDVAAFTDTISARTEDVDAIISDAKEVAANLREASTRVDGVLAKVDDLLGSGEAEGLFADASVTLKSFRTVADTLNARLGGILDNLSRFSGGGLRDAEALIRDSRRSITRIEEAITSFERNPQRIITGGEGAVREYDGRVRR